MAYHTIVIKKGHVGEMSKISEEYEELMDAHNQENPIMVLVEISDLLGAIDSYLQKYHHINIDEALKMTKATQSAFSDGTRK
jgi:phosphoribosyl-ATP pyrophosphohydrolase